MSVPFKILSAATIGIGLTVPVVKAQAISLDQLNNGANIAVDDQTYSNWNVSNKSSSVTLGNIDVTGVNIDSQTQGVQFDFGNEISASSPAGSGSIEETILNITYEASVAPGSNPIGASELEFPQSNDVSTSGDSALAVTRDFGASGIGGSVRNEIAQETTAGFTTQTLSDSATFTPQQNIAVTNGIEVQTEDFGFSTSEAQIQRVEQRFEQVNPDPVPYEIEGSVGLLALGTLLGGRKLLGIYRKRRLTNS